MLSVQLVRKVSSGIHFRDVRRGALFVHTPGNPRGMASLIVTLRAAAGGLGAAVEVDSQPHRGHGFQAKINSSTCFYRPMPCKFLHPSAPAPITANWYLLHFLLHGQVLFDFLDRDCSVPPFSPEVQGTPRHMRLGRLPVMMADSILCLPSIAVSPNKKTQS